MRRSAILMVQETQTEGRRRRGGQICTDALHSIMNGKAKKRTRALAVTVLLSAGILCTACSPKPISQGRMARYVEKSYGPAELVRAEASEKSATYTFKDGEYGFEYWVRSYVTGFNVDGSNFFDYESKDSDFEEQYYACLTKELEGDMRRLEEDYHINIEPAYIKHGGYDVKTFGLADITMGEDNQEDAPRAALEAANLYIGRDARHFWQEGRVSTYAPDGSLLGYYDLSKGRYVTAAEDDAGRFKVMAELKDRTSELQYVEEVSAEEFLQRSGCNARDLQDWDYGPVPLYHFRTKSGLEYYIADVIYHGDLYSDFPEG